MAGGAGSCCICSAVYKKQRKKGNFCKAVTPQNPPLLMFFCSNVYVQTVSSVLSVSNQRPGVLTYLFRGSVVVALGLMLGLDFDILALGLFSRKIELLDSNWPWVIWDSPPYAVRAIG